MNFVFRLCAVWLVAAAGCANSHGVGFADMRVPPSVDGSGFPMTVFYPTDAEPAVVKLGPFTLNVAEGGGVLEGKHPLVIISHGSGGSGLSYKDVAISLAKSGFIVGVPLHPKNNYLDNTLEGSVANYASRPKHLSLAIDKLLDDLRFGASIDSSRVAVLGHSVGGYAAVAAAGGVGDTSGLIDVCKKYPLLKDPYCAPVRDGSVPRTVIEGRKDPRIRAAVLMAPVGVLFSAEGSLDDVDIPVLILRAEKDAEVTEPYNADVIEKGLPDKQKITSWVVPNAGHYSFLTSFPDFLKPELGSIAEDPVGFNRSEFQEKLGVIVANYLKGVLR